MNSLCRGFGVLNRCVLYNIEKRLSLASFSQLATFQKYSIASEVNEKRSESQRFLTGPSVSIRSLSAFTKTAKGIPKYASKGDREEEFEENDRDNDFYGGSSPSTGEKRYNSGGKYSDYNKGRPTRFDSKSSRYDSKPRQPPQSKNVRKLIRKYNLVDFGGKGRGPMEVEAVETDYHEKLASGGAGNEGFAKYNLPAKLQERMDQLGYTSPFKIQAATLEHTLDGQDVFAKAFTGSGKTLAFAIPIIKKLTEIDEAGIKKKAGHPRCLVLSPTRELCQQIYDTLQKLAPNLKCMATYGGVNMEQQMYQLRGNIDIVCATPGRLRDLFQRQHLKTSDIKIICLDEADALLKPDFMEQIEEILQSVKEKQMLMFSATLSEEVEQLLESHMNKPKMIDLTRNEAMPLPKNINHYLVQVRKNQVGSAVKHLIEKFDSEKCIVFVNRIVDTQFYANMLTKMGIRAAAISSDKSQSMRSSIIRNFKLGSTKVLVATDVAARGLDVPSVNLIINIGSSSNGLEAYIHRSGRTGRAGKIGSSIVIDAGFEDSGISDIKQLIKLKEIEIPEEVLQASASSRDRERGFERFDDERERPRSRETYRRPAAAEEIDHSDDDDFEDYKPKSRYSSQKPSYNSKFSQKQRPNKWNVE